MFKTMWPSDNNFTKSMAWSTMIYLIYYSTIFSAPNLVDPLKKRYLRTTILIKQKNGVK